MLSSVYRFHSRGGVKYTYKNGRTTRGNGFLVVAVLSSGRKNSRFAVVVSKKVLKSAVGRNRIRRRVYEMLRLEIAKFKSPVDVIVVVKNSEVKDIAYLEMEMELRRLFKEAGLYKV